MVKIIKTHILFSKPFSENRAVYEIMWRNKVKSERRDDNIVRRMLDACANAPQQPV